MLRVVFVMACRMILRGRLLGIASLSLAFVCFAYALLGRHFAVTAACRPRVQYSCDTRSVDG